MQVYKPGGIINAPGTPLLLRDLSDDCYQCQITDLMQGGLDKAEFDMRMQYEDQLDLVAGNWVLFAGLGALLSSNGSPGDGHVTVSNLQNFQIPKVFPQQVVLQGGNVGQANLDLIQGDLVVVTDGVNAELFRVSGIAGSGPHWTISLGPAWGTVQIATACILKQDVPLNSGTILVDKADNISSSPPFNKIAIAGDSYTVTSISGKQPNGFYQVHISPNTTASYSNGTPISVAGKGSSEILVTTIGGSGNTGVPVGQISLDSGGPNAEAVTIASKSGAQKLLLSSALQNGHGAGAPVLFQMKSTLSNSFAAGQTIIARVQYQGYLTPRVRSTQKPMQFSISTQGFFNRYNTFLDSSIVTAQDACKQLLHDVASYASALPGVIVNNTTPEEFFAESNGVKVNINATNETFTELIDTILRQENGTSTTIQYCCWVQQDRQFRHLPVATADPSAQFKIGKHTYVTPTYYMSLEDGSGGMDPKYPCFGDTISYVQTTDMDMSNLINAAIVSGTTPPDGGSSIYNENTTTLAQQLLQGQTSMDVTSIPTTWPNGGGGLYVLVNRGQSTDENRGYVSYEGTHVNVATGFGETLGVGTAVELVTKLTGNHSPGAQSFQVGNANIFSSGQQITFTPTGSTEETLTIDSINYGSNTITTTTAAKKAHASGDIACLSKNGSGSGPRILMEQLDSIGDFGFFEGTFDSEDIYTEDKLKEWAGQQLKVLAWPVSNSEVMLATTQGRITGRDLVQIGPFYDGSYLVQNVNSVQYNWTAADQNVSATLKMGILRSTASGVMKQISKQRNHRQRYHYPNQKGNQNGHQEGHEIQQTGANQITINAGVVQLNGQIYPVAGGTFTAPEGESRWGAACGPGVTPGTESVVELPKRFWNGRSVYAHEAVYTIDQSGDQPQLERSFSGIPLWKVRVVNGNIAGMAPLFDTKGVGLKNHPSAVTPAAPSYTPSSIAATAEANGVAGDLAIVGAVTNFPTDDSTDLIRVWVRTTGTTLWSLKHTIIADGLPQPTVGQQVDCVVHGVPLGVEIDVGLSFKGTNYESPITVIEGGFSMPGVTVTAQFPGATLNTDGSFSNLDGVLSAQTFVLKSHQQVTLEAQIAIGTAGSGQMGGILLGSATNGYALEWNGTSNAVELAVYVASARSVLATLVSLTQTTTIHEYKLIVSVNGGGPGLNVIQGSFGGSQSLTVLDNNLLLTSGTWGVTLETGGQNGRATQINSDWSAPIYLDLPAPAQIVINQDGSLGNGVQIGSTASGAGIYTGTSAPTGTSYIKGSEYHQTGGGPSAGTFWVFNGSAWVQVV